MANISMIMRLFHFLLKSSSFGVDFPSLERGPDISSTKNDYRMEECPSFSNPFNHLPSPQQCSVCYLNFCGPINISDNGQSENCHNRDLIQVVPKEEAVKSSLDGYYFISSWNDYEPGKGLGGSSCDSLFSAPIEGYMLGLLSACLSALAGVYTEYLMKKNNGSLYWQNFQLYIFGAIFNMACLLWEDSRVGFEKGLLRQRLFNGYTIMTWLVVLHLGSSGLLVSWLMKYADNIVKVYSTSMAMLLTMVLSIDLFNIKPTVQHGISTSMKILGANKGLYKLPTKKK